MALQLKFKTQQDRGAERLWLTNLTGEYNATDNQGGFGIAGTPNPDLGQICLLAIIQRNASSGAQNLEAVGSATQYNPSAVNTDENVFEFVYINDGWHSMNLVVLPASSNQTTDQLGAEIQVGQYYYYTVDNTVYLKVSLTNPEQDTPIEEEDYPEVLNQVDIITTRCEDVFLSKLSVQREDQYIDYRKTRKGVCTPDQQFNAMRELTEDLISIDYTFRSGLMVQSQDQTETILDEQNLD